MSHCLFQWRALPSQMLFVSGQTNTRRTYHVRLVCVCANFFPLFCIVFSLITNNFLRIFSLFLEKSILFNLTRWVLMIFFASNALLLNTITHTETERSETAIDLNFSSECCLQWIGKLIRLLSKWHQRTCVHCRFGPIKEEYIWFIG